MGFGVDLNTTVADLMRVASVGAGVLGSLGPMISGLASSFSGQSMLSKMGIGKGSGLQVTPRGGDGVGGGGGAGGGLVGGGNETTSGSGYVGNGSGSDVKNSTIQESEDSKKQQMIEAKEEEPANQVDVLNTTVIKIYELLDSVSRGSKTLRVRVDNYGLTGSSSTGSQGGVDGLLNSGANNSGSLGGNSSLGGSSELSGSVSSGSSGTGSVSSGNGSAASSGANSSAIDLGGWTMM
jgi:hypothetical protein